MDKLENKNIISLDSKKRIIDYKLLNDGHYYDNLVFYLIRTKYFDKIIAKIDDVEIIYGVKVQENNNLTCSRFLFLLDSLSNTVRTRRGDNYYIEKATNFYMKLYEKILIKYEKKKPFMKYFK